jgi:hypothetical protein
MATKKGIVDKVKDAIAGVFTSNDASARHKPAKGASAKKVAANKTVAKKAASKKMAPAKKSRK